jgi:hypothetical protein
MDNDEYGHTGEVPEAAEAPEPNGSVPVDYDPARVPEKFGWDMREMTDRDLLEEIVFQGRSIAAALSSFQSMGPADLVKTLLAPKKK